MKQQQLLTSEATESSEYVTRRTWPDSYLAMAPCLVAVLALSGAARSGASPQEKQAPSRETETSQEASTTTIAPAVPKTRITNDSTKAASAPGSKTLAQPRIAKPFEYGSGDLRVLPASLTGKEETEATVSPATLGLPSESKVIDVEKLKLPPTSKPLPGWMQKAVVSADQHNIDQATLGKQTAKDTLTRLAQLPSIKPAWGKKADEKPSAAPAKLPNQITVAASTYVVLMANTDLQTVAVADPEIADVSVINAKAVLVNGKSAGSTTLVIVDKVGKIRQYSVKVTPAQGARPEDIERAIGVDGVHVRQLRDTIVLEGQVEDNDAIQQAVQIAGIYAPKVLNLLQVKGALSGPAGTAAQIENAIQQPNVHVSMLAGTAVLQGTVPSEAEKAQAEKVASLFAPKVLNLLQLPQLSVDQIKNTLGASDQPPALEVIGNGSFGSLAPKPYITIRQSGDQLILEGYEPADYDVAGTLALAARSGLQVVNRIRLAPPLTKDQQLLDTIASAIGIPGVHVRGTKKRVVLEGVVGDTNAAVTAGQIALGYADQVDNMLQTTHPIQVNVDVSLVEITNKDIKALGINGPDTLLGTEGTAGTAPNGAPAGTTGSLPIGSVGIGGGYATTLGTQLGLQLKAAIDKGDAHMLSNPRTTVLSGRTASFQSGGQVPIPTSITDTGNGNILVQVEYKNFGIMMDVTPIANKDGTVTMRVRTDVTQIDRTTSQAIGSGVTVPGFTRRAAITEVTVPAGGSIALSGLLQSNLNKYVREVPVLSKIPILGKLFTSTRYEKGESDLVIFVTPRVLPNPLTDGNTAPAAVTAVGPNTTAAVELGNPGIQSFSTLGQETNSGGNGGNGNGGSTQ